MTRPKVLCDGWYSHELGANVVSYEDYLKDRLGTRLAELVLRVSSLRMMLLWLYGHEFDYIVPDWYRYGRTFCILQAISRKRKVILLECVDVSALHKGTLRTRVYKWAVRCLIGPAVRRSVIKVHMMTVGERSAFTRVFGLERDVAVCIRWPLGTMHTAIARQTASPDRHEASDRVQTPYVFSSGRTYCDWTTLFQAANSGNWPLVIVCSRKDLPKVQSLNASGRAKAHSEVSWEEHQALLAGSAVYVLSIKEQMTSAGQIRLGEAISAGVPIVATAVRGLEGYLIDGVTGRSVPVGDAAAMSKVIENLLGDERGRSALATRAGAYAAKFTRAGYFAALDTMIGSLPASAGNTTYHERGKRGSRRDVTSTRLSPM